MRLTSVFTNPSIPITYTCVLNQFEEKNNSVFFLYCKNNVAVKNLKIIVVTFLYYDVPLTHVFVFENRESPSLFCTM